MRPRTPNLHRRHCERVVFAPDVIFRGEFKQWLCFMVPRTFLAQTNTSCCFDPWAKAAINYCQPVLFGDREVTCHVHILEITPQRT